MKKFFTLSIDEMKIFNEKTKNIDWTDRHQVDSLADEIGVVYSTLMGVRAGSAMQRKTHEKFAVYFGFFSAKQNEETLVEKVTSFIAKFDRETLTAVEEVFRLLKESVGVKESVGA